MTTIVCPHCGDVTEHDMLLAEFTCGACDCLFRPPSQRLEVEPTDQFFEATGVVVRGWRGSFAGQDDVIAFIAGLALPNDTPPPGNFRPIPPPVPEWSAIVTESMAELWRLAGRLSDREASDLVGFARARAAFRDPSFPVRECPHCGDDFRGPGIYCQLSCAFASA